MPEKANCRIINNRKEKQELDLEKRWYIRGGCCF